MNCKEFKKYSIEFIEGTLPHPLMKEMETHLHKCEKCRLRLENLQKTIKLLKKDTAIPPLSRAKQNSLFPIVMQRIEKQRMKIRKIRVWTYSLSTGIAVVIISLLSILSIQKTRNNTIITFSINPNHLVYTEDTLVNNYIAEALIKNDTLFTQIENIEINGLETTSDINTLIEGLSTKEIDKLTNELKNINFKDII